MLCFNYTATTEIYTYGHTLARHDALPVSRVGRVRDVVHARRQDHERRRRAHQQGVDVDRERLHEALLRRMLHLGRRGRVRTGALPGLRSEEHTSELQSLMRISYAVFCLKKKTTHRYRHTEITVVYQTSETMK